MLPRLGGQPCPRDEDRHLLRPTAGRLLEEGFGLVEATELDKRFGHPEARFRGLGESLGDVAPSLERGLPCLMCQEHSSASGMPVVHVRKPGGELPVEGVGLVEPLQPEEDVGKRQKHPQRWLGHVGQGLTEMENGAVVVPPSQTIHPSLDEVRPRRGGKSQRFLQGIPGRASRWEPGEEPSPARCGSRATIAFRRACDCGRGGLHVLPIDPAGRHD